MLKNLKLRWKISIILIIIMSIIMSIVSLVNYISTTRIIKNEVNAKIQTVNKLYKSTINSIFIELDRRAKELAADDSLVSYVDIVDYRYQELNKVKSGVSSNSSDSREMKEEREKLNNLVSSNLENYVANITWGYLEKINYIDFCYITLIDGMVISSSTRYNKINNLTNLKRQYLNTSEYKDVNFNSIKEINQQPYLLFNTSIKDSNHKVIGYLVLGLSLNSLKDTIDITLGEYSNVVALLNNEGLILNNPYRGKLGRVIKDDWVLKTIESDQLPVDKLGAENYCIVDKLENKDLYLTATVLKSDILAPATRLGKIDIYIFVIGIILTIIIIYISMGWQLRPLNLLVKKMGKVRKGDLDVQLNITTEDEIGLLAKTFNKMINDLKRLMIKVKEDQEEIRKQELSALQLQINPHFLYNTLDSISLMTKTKEYDEIAEMCIALSQFFRLGLNDGKETYTIRDEIEHIKNYIIIQKLRYPDKFEYSVDVDEEIYNNECIKIILQPLVENSLQHGFKYHKSRGHIYINGFKKEGEIVLQVIDDGCGFNEEMLKSFSTSDKNQKAYALRNVGRRIQLNYGSDYGLKIYNSNSGGACVELHLPVKFKGDKNV